MRYVYSVAAIAVALILFVPPRLQAQIDPAKLTVAQYALVNSTRYNRDQWYFTYTASLVNAGPVTPAITATVTSTATNIQVVAGQGTLHFPPAQPNGVVSSVDSFTILVDRTVPFDVSSLKWFFMNPLANAGSNQTVTVGSTVSLNGGGSTNPSGVGTLSFNWQFVSVPPGSKASLSNAATASPSFVVDTGGSYVVQLVVSNGSGSDAATVTVSTQNSPPVANAGANQTVGISSTVTLNGSKSYDVDGDSLTYWWTFVSMPANSATVLYSQRSVAPYFVADVNGTYIIQLVVNDGALNSQPVTVTVSTANTPPTANAGRNQTVNVQSLVQLNGAGSTDVDGDPLTYRWSFNSVPPGSQAALSDPAAVNPTFTADKVGTYLVQLIVNDGKVDSQPATVTISTNVVQAPTANAGLNQTIAHGNVVQLSGGGTDPQNLTLTYAWSMISQPQGSSASLSAKNIWNPTFTADLPGTYVIQLIVNDGYLSSQPVTVTITTTNTAPVANPGAGQSVYANSTVYLDGSQSYDADHDPIVSYSWTFNSKPSGSNATLSGANTKTPTFVADVAGAYVVQLIVADQYSTSEPKTVTINAGTKSIVFSPNPLSLYNSPQSVSISLTPTPTDPVSLNFSNFDPTVVDVPLTAIVPANASGVNITVTPRAPGSTQITANATGYYTSNLSVTVKQPTISIALQNGATGVGVSHTLNGTITLDVPAPAPNGAVISLSSSPSPDGAVTFDSVRVTIPAGSSTGAFQITGSQLGTAVITAAAGGYYSGNLTVQVVMLGGISLPTGFTVPYGHSASLNVKISTPAPVGGVTVSLASSDTSTLTVTPSSVFIKFGSTAPDTAPQANGIALGTAKITASADGFSGDSQNVQVMATLTFSTQAVSVSAGGVQMFHILLSAPAPTGGLLVNLSSDTPRVATVTSQVWIYGPSQSGDATVTGVAAGTATVKASINTGIGFNQYFSTDSAVLSVSVTDLAITTSALPAGTAGAAFPTTSLAASGGSRTGYAWSVVSGSLPLGLTLSSGGSLSGTVSNSATSTSVTIQVQDSIANVATKVFAITINQAPSISPAALATGTINQPYSQSMTVTGGTGPYTWSATGLPSPLTIGSSSGTISGTPTATFSGTVTIKVTDNNGATATITPTLTIYAALSISPSTLPAGMVGQAYSQTMSATGGATPYTWSATGLPSPLTIGSSSGAIGGTPTAAFSGTVTIKVTDNNGATATITPALTIYAALSISPSTLPGGTVNQVYSQTMSAAGGASPYTWSATGLPSPLTIGSSSGVISGTPTAASSGTVTIKVTDNNGFSATITPTLTINGAISISPATLPAGMVGHAYSQTMTATGGATPYTWSATGLPSPLTIGSSSGIISGTPAAAFSGAVTIKITDNNGATATIAPTLTIYAALSISPSTLPAGMVGQAYSQTMTATGGASPYTWSTTGLPSPLTIGSSSGVISGTPTAAFSGTVTIKVTDNNGFTATITPTLTINAALSISPTTLATGLVNQAYSQTMTATGGASPYTWSATGLPSPLTIGSSSGIISGTPTAAFSGTVTIKVTDNNGFTATITPTLTINAALSISPTTLPAGMVSHAYSQTMTASGGASPYTWSAIGLPSPLTIGSSSGVISGTPTAASSGTVTIKVTDNNGATATITPTLTIYAALGISPTTLPAGMAGQAYSQTMSATGGASPYTWSATSLPSPLTIGSSSGVISGTPTAASSGTVTIKVTDNNGFTATITPTLTISTALSISPSTLPAGTANQAYSQAMSASGGTSPYTWSATGLPSPLTIGSSSGVISGTPTAAFSATVTIKVTDNNGFTATITPTLTINAALAISPTTVSAGMVSHAYSQTMTASGGASPYTWSATGLPSPLTIGSSSGVISGTPTAASSGTVSIKVTDNNGATATITPTLTIYAALSISPSTLPAGIANQAYNQTMTASGGASPYTWSATGLPSPLTIGSSSGVISGTPTAAFSATVTIKVTDNNGFTATITPTLTIYTALGISPSTLPAGTANQAYSQTMTASGGTSPYTWSATGLPSPLTIGSSSGVISGTPTAAFSGAVTIKVTDNNGFTTTITPTLTVHGDISISPTALPAGMANHAYSQTMTATGGTSPYTWSATGLPSPLTIGSSSGIVSGTPTAAFSGTVTIKVTDNNGTTATITPVLTIYAALGISPSTLSAGMVNQAYSQTMTATGGASPYTWSATGLPSTLTIGSSSGTISGTPTAAFSGTITIKVTDNNGFTASITPTLNVYAALSISPSTLPAGTANQAYSQTMSATGGASPYAWSATGLPSPLTIGSSSGVLSGTPAAAFSGTVTIKVTDNSGFTATITPTLTINAALSISPTTLSAGMVSRAYSQTMSAAGGASPYTWSATGLPSPLTIGSSSGIISGTPAAAFSGTVTIKVTDNNGATATIAPTLTIYAALSISPSTLPAGTANQAYSQTMTATGGASPYTWSATGLPSPLTIGSSSGVISGTPNAAFSGTVTIKVTDNNGFTATITPTLTINAALSISPSTLPAGMVSHAYSQTMTASGGASPYTWSATGLPGPLTIGSSSGVISGTPTAASSGTVTIKVTDNNGATATITPTLTISAALGISPTTLPAGMVGQAYSQTMSATGGASPYTWSATSLPSPLTIGSSSGVISGTPTAAASGTVTIKVTDNNGFTATITPTLTISTALSISPSTLPAGTVNQAYSQAMSASGGTSPYTWSATGLPSPLTIGSSSGVISGTPTAAFSATVTIKVTDNNGFTATITPTLTINAALSISPTTVSAGMVSHAYSQTMTASGGASPYTWSATGLPSPLTIGSSSGVISGTPTAASSGTVTIKVTDNNGATATITPTLTIYAALGISPSTLPAGIANQAYNQTMTATGGASPYTWSATGLPSPLTIGTSSGAISGTPTAAFSGTVTIKVTDNNGFTATITPTLTINAALSISPTTLAAGLVNQAYSQTMTATGGASPYTWSATGLPSPLTIGSSSGVISGTPTAASSGTVTIKVTDNNGATATITPTLTINAALSISTSSLPAGTPGVAYTSTTLTATGGTGSGYTWTVSSGSLPSGLTLSTGGTISGTVGTAATSSTFTIQVQDSGSNKATKSFTITVNLAITTSTLPNAQVNVAYSQNLAAGGGTPAYTWSATGLPSWLQLNSVTGTLSGTPRSGGTINITVTVTDSKNATASKPFTFVVASGAPTFTTTSLPIATVNTPYSAQIVVTGGTTPYMWSTTGLPSWLTLDTTGACGGSSSTPMLCGTPPSLGTVNFSITVTDSLNQQVSQPLSLTVSVNGTLGTITVSSANIGLNMQMPITITLSPAPTVAVTLTISSGSPGSVLLGSNSDAGSATLTPTLSVGTTSVGTYAKAFANSGTVTITASAPGYANGTGTITLANGGFVIAASNGIGGSLTTYQKASSALTIYPARLDSQGVFVESQPVRGGLTVIVPLSSSPTTVGTVSPSSVTFNGGDPSQTATFTASSTNTGNASIVVSQPSGYVPAFTNPSTGATINVTVLPSGLIAPAAVTVGKNLQTTATVGINAAASSPVLVTLTSSDSRLQFASSPTGASSTTLNVTIPQNQATSSDFYIRGYDSSGTISYTISANGYGQVSSTVQLGPSGFLIHTPAGFGSNFSMGLGGSDAELDIYTALYNTTGSPVARQSLAGDQSVTANLTSIPSTVGDVTSHQVTLTGGSSYASTFFHAASTGTAGVTASAVGYQSNSVQATVQASTVNININGLVIGNFLEGQATLTLSAPAPSGGLAVTLTSNSSLLRLSKNATDAGAASIVVIVPQGATAATYYVYSQGSTGTATYSASAPGYASTGDDTVTFAPSGIVLYPKDSSSLSVGGTSGFYVYTAQLSTDGSNSPVTPQSLAGSATLNVSLTNSNPAAGTLNGSSAGTVSIAISPGTNNSIVTFAATASGSSTISVTQPNGWTLPSALQQLGFLVF
jgi:hypothetical protein